ncbi:Yip1 family protein [Amaricoccus sp.]|uniref:Yip1 family protein n=1 Tax=Amaricoccus sp. TaxID=1872485 RepID=UPI002605AF91|nr:Yip1 family protein [uncultured Amaricoccus sp.]
MTRRWAELVKESFLRPRTAARRILGMRFGPNELLQLALVITCLGIILAFVAMRVSGGVVDGVATWMLGTPLLGALVEFALLGVIAVLTHRIGALFGGSGSFWDALTLLVWLNAVMLVLQVAQLLMLFVLPPLAPPVAFFAVFWGLWAFANFVTELHGFNNPMMVLGGVVLTTIVLFIGVAMLLAILGITPSGGT